MRLPPSAVTEGGTRKGLDITFGRVLLSSQSGPAVASSISGGILIRSIRRVGDQKIISGPSLVVDEILRQSNASDIKTLVVDQWRKRVDALQPPTDGLGMWLAPWGNDNPKSKPILYTSPRIGLDLSHQSATVKLDDPRVVYVGKPYRFFTCPESLKANGRVQTFVGLVLPLITGNTLPRSTIYSHAAAQGFSASVVKKYIEAFENGLLSGKLVQFVGSVGKNVSSSAIRYIQMMATLHQLGVI